VTERGPLLPEIRYVPTTDGWALALHRYTASASGAPAVILCSGYGCNRHFIDFDERYSLARYLARCGFDAWVVELRGRGMSHALPGCRHPQSWTFDDLVRIDVPAAIEFVQRHVGHPRLCWIGHSMGGMVIYAYLGLAREQGMLAAAVTLASPIGFAPMASQLTRQLGELLLALPFPARIPQRVVLGALWQLVGRTRALEVGMNPDNVDRAVVGVALRRSICDVPRAKLRQLSGWALRGGFASNDGRIDYRQNLRHVRTPMLTIAGACDRLAPPENVGIAYDLLASARKRFVVLGKAQHFSTDYGHVDTVFGRRAPDEVYPLIADWVGDTLAAAAA
jgi:predicted alpha/beta hydrolase